MNNPFDHQCFEDGRISFTVYEKPVSLQNPGEKKEIFKHEVHQVTASSEFLITSTCWVAIDYYCRHINRFKYPGVYDIDNIVKPILDSLVGHNGILIDDVIVDRVTVNWIDSPCDDFFEVNIEYPDLLFMTKANLVILKSNSGWCYPSTSTDNQEYLELIKDYFTRWNSIKTEDDYYEALPLLPIQQFIYFSKIKDRGYRFLDIEKLA